MTKKATPVNGSKVNIKELFLGLQTRLLADLEVSRRIITHPSTKGDASEINWLGMMQVHLPSRYQARKAFVLDAHGNLSDQLDVVIFDRHYCPLLLNKDEAMYVPAESVYAVLEVKQELNKGYVEYAGNKIGSVRRLHRTSVPIQHAGGTFPAKPHFNILGGVLTLGSDWKSGIGAPLKKALAALPVPNRLDFGCVLQHGGFEATYSPSGATDVETSASDTALVFFFMRLLSRLQSLGTVPALDLHEYTRYL
ncbi:MAG: hypothetical protein IT318_25825 [Anaerolineales bacterium]|nr:hypothetical protein [Anaerolineales bacterium]